MKRFRRPMLVISLVIVAIIQAACNPTYYQKIKSAVDLATPFVNSLGIIPVTAQAMIADFGDMIPIAANLDAGLSAAKTFAEKLAPSSAAYAAFLIIYKRGNFGKDQRVLRVADAMGAVFKAVADYYGARPSLTGRPMSEKDFAKGIDAKIEAVKKMMK